MQEVSIQFEFHMVRQLLASVPEQAWLLKKEGDQNSFVHGGHLNVKTWDESGLTHVTKYVAGLLTGSG